jgi:AtzE family amidohydrolase
MSATWITRSAHDMAAAVRSGAASATELVTQSLQRIADTDVRVNAFTSVVAERALAEAAALDDRLSIGNRAALDALPLLGVPFAVKNLFDVRGLPTLAGSKIERDSPPASHDAVLIERMEAAGAILVGTLNMDEYAYGFTTENSHYGATHNPHDLARIAGGSSGGSGAALAAGQVPITLGSDTNGSIRVPSSLCGVFGLKPTYGRLPRNGSYPFVFSLDVLGSLARSVRDLALSYDAMQGHDARDAACAARAVEPVSGLLDHGAAGLRIAVLDGYFADNAGPQARAAVLTVADALGAKRKLELPDAARARAAAFVIGNSEGATLHIADLRRRAADFEPLSRDRFIAGALLPAAWVMQAQRLRRWFAEEVARTFLGVDILLAPATPRSATEIGSESMDVNGRMIPTRPNMGLLTQPISCIGLPVCTVPVWPSAGGERMPIGVQIIAAPWREDLVLRVAADLEKSGIVAARVATL